MYPGAAANDSDRIEKSRENLEKIAGKEYL